MLEPPAFEMLGEFEPLLIVCRLDGVRVDAAFIGSLDVSREVR